MINPFHVKFELTVAASPAEVSDRLLSCIKPLKLEESFEKSLHPLGTVIGTIVDSHFEIHESMYGFGGASASGTIMGTNNGAIIHCDIKPGLFMRYSFAILSLVYAFICFLFVQAFFETGLTVRQYSAFVIYSLIFAGAWSLMIKEMKDLTSFLMNMANL